MLPLFIIIITLANRAFKSKVLIVHTANHHKSLLPLLPQSTHSERGGCAYKNEASLKLS